MRKEAGKKGGTKHTPILYIHQLTVLSYYYYYYYYGYYRLIGVGKKV